MPTRGINWVFATSVVMAIVGTSIPAGLAAAITVTSLLFAIWVRAKTSQIGLITALWLSFWLAHPISPKPIPFNLDQDKADAERAAQVGPLLTDDDTQELIQWLEDPLQNDVGPEFGAKLSLLPDYSSVTVFDLNMEPVYWTGRPSSSRGRHSEWVITSTDAIYRYLHPIPNLEQARGYLAHEIHFASQNSQRLAASFLGSRYPDLKGMIININPTRFDGQHLPIHGISLPRTTYVQELAAVCFLVLVMTLIISLHRNAPQGSRQLTLILVVLALSHARELATTTVFSPAIFGLQQPLNLLVTPFHLVMTPFLLFLLLRRMSMMWTHHWAKASIASLSLIIAMAWLSPYLGTGLSPSPVHPLEGLDSWGSFCALIGYYLVHGYSVWMIRVWSNHTKLWQRLAQVVTLLMVVWAISGTLPLAMCALSVAWVVAGLRHARTLRQFTLAAMACSTFYVDIYLNEQESELRRIQHEMVDDITMLSDRNHARMAQFKVAVDKLDTQYLPAAAEWLAHEAGFNRANVSYGIRLVSQDGEIVSESADRLLMDQIPAFLAPSDRIEIYRENEQAPLWMIFRTSLQLEDRELDAIAILGNDIHNLDLVSDFAGTEQQRYFAFQLETYTTSGIPYDTHNMVPVQPDELEALDQQGIVWRESGRKSWLLTRDEHYIYRITHTKTPIRMVLARWLLVTLLLWIALQILRFLAMARYPLRIAWQRSFALKFAYLVFMGSIIPTAALGGFLFSSININQTKDLRSQLESRMSELLDLMDAFPFRESGQTDARWTAVSQFAGQLADNRISFYRKGHLIQTTQPELFQSGRFDARLPFEIHRDLIKHKTSLAFRSSNDGSITEVLAVFGSELHNAFVVGLSQSQSSHRSILRWQEQGEFTAAVILALLYIMANLALAMARQSLRPVKAITRGASRIARGMSQKPIKVDRFDEFSRMVDAFNTMQQQINWSQRELSRQLGLFDVTIQSMSSGIIGCDDQQRIVLSNTRVAEMLNTTPLPSTMTDLMEAQPGARPLEVILGHKDTREARLSIDQRDLLVMARWRRPAFEGDVSQILVFDDITHVLASSRLQAWSEMARRVAHEIKNPLTPIQLEMDHILHLQRIKHEHFEEELRASSQIIREQIEHLRRIAIEFGDYARPMVLEIKPTDLAAIIKRVIGPYQRSVPNLEVIMTLAQGIICPLDERLVRRSIHNLIENAVQAMEQNGKLILDLSREDSFALLTIQDNGPGIAPEDNQRIFEAYFSTKDQGTGLGLAIAKKTIEEHGGSLMIDTNYTTGARVVVRLPLM